MEEAKKLTKVAYKYCLVPECTNTTLKTPDKVFFRISNDEKIRKLWCKVMRRNNVSPKSCLYCCEDHFNVMEDTENYIQYIFMKAQGEKCTLRLKKGVLPHIFLCQKQRMPLPKERMAVVKRQRLTLVNEAFSSVIALKSSDVSEPSQRSDHETSPGPSQTPAQPTLAVDYGDGRVSPATDTEDQQEELEIKKEPEEEVKIEEFDRSNVIMIQDPLAQTTWQGSYKELTQPSGVALQNQFVQPSTSTLQVPDSFITVPLVVVSDTDYKTMFSKLQEEVEMLKNQNQSLLLENQSLTRQLIELRQNVEMSADVKSLQDNDVIREFAEKNQKLNEQILEYTEKMRTITEKYEGLSSGASLEQPGQIEKTDDNTGNNDPKCCTVPEHENLMEKVHTLSTELKEMMAENKFLKRNLKMQRKRCERLKMLSSVKSENIKKLKLGYLKLKSIYVKLKMLKSLQ